MEYNLILEGRIAADAKGDAIPQKIRRALVGHRGEDKISIRRGDRSFFMYVNEEIDNQMGDSLDKLAGEEGRKNFPSVGYDNALEADIYELNLAQLQRVWDLYRGGPNQSQRITETQRRARQANMDTALRAKAEKREKQRQSRLKGR